MPPLTKKQGVAHWVPGCWLAERRSVERNPVHAKSQTLDTKDGLIRMCRVGNKTLTRTINEQVEFFKNRDAK